MCFSDTGSGYEEIVPGGRILLINGHELLITTTESTDSGLYQCNASNSQGFVNDFARLTVFGKISFISLFSIGGQADLILVLNESASSIDSYKPTQMQSLARGFAACKHKVRK